MTDKHMKRCLTSLTDKETEIKTAMTYYPILVVMATVKKN